MNCERPYTQDGLAFPCGGCLACRHQRARVWTHRLILEATQHTHNTFLTLTYTDEKVIENAGSVNPSDLTKFIKRLRKKGQSFRYYAVGEYGPKTLRPHYHMAMFGLRTCERGQTDLRKPYCCAQCATISATWGMGAVQLARLEDASAAYVAGYVTKKLTASPLPKELHPEFQRMSLKPGLGYDCMHDVADILLRHGDDIEDVPVALQHGKKKHPLGKYLRRSLRKMIGRDEKAPESTLLKIKEGLQPLRTLAFENSTSLQKAIVDANKTKLASFLQRKHIHSQRKSL